MTRFWVVGAVELDVGPPGVQQGLDRVGVDSATTTIWVDSSSATTASMMAARSGKSSEIDGSAILISRAIARRLTASSVPVRWRIVVAAEIISARNRCPVPGPFVRGECEGPHPPQMSRVPIFTGRPVHVPRQRLTDCFLAPNTGISDPTRRAPAGMSVE